MTMNSKPKFVGDIGWVKWRPGLKDHYMMEILGGLCGSACGAYRTPCNTSLLNMVSRPTEEEKCKICVRKLKVRMEIYNTTQISRAGATP